jgi:hypothetical protein
MRRWAERPTLSKKVSSQSGTNRCNTHDSDVSPRGIFHAVSSAFARTPYIEQNWHITCIRRNTMALLVRALLWTIVVLAPGGLLLLPFLAMHHLGKSQKSASRNEHAHVH